MTKVLVISDLHCGNLSGLTPPGLDAKPGRGLIEQLKAYDFRKWHWNQYQKAVTGIGKIDIVIVNGDMIDGPGEASGGTEELTVNRQDQIAMAVESLRAIPGSPSFFMTYGTSYHTGREEDWERDVAEAMNAKIGDDDNLKIHGVIFNYKHHLSASQIPHGRFTAVARDKLWKDMWALRGEYPQSNVIIRSHVHYYGGAFGYDVDPWVALTTPALQGYGSKYARRLSGTVDMGVLVFEVEKGGYFSHQPILWRQKYKEPTEAI